MARPARPVRRRSRTRGFRTRRGGATTISRRRGTRSSPSSSAHELVAGRPRALPRRGPASPASDGPASACRPSCARDTRCPSPDRPRPAPDRIPRRRMLRRRTDSSPWWRSSQRSSTARTARCLRLAFPRCSERTLSRPPVREANAAAEALVGNRVRLDHGAAGDDDLVADDARSCRRRDAEARRRFSMCPIRACLPMRTTLSMTARSTRAPASMRESVRMTDSRTTAFGPM